MDAAGQARAIGALDALRPRGQTNLWGGLLASLESLRNGGGDNHKVVFCLTDGAPNITPPRGHIRELQTYKDKHVDFMFSCNTFGFGYSLDSDLLLSISRECQGCFVFIPDAP